MQIFDGTYQLEERLDQGASADVWRVVDTLTNTTLALKIYSPNGEMGTNGFQMMAHEFKIMVNASHQNLLKPLHFGISEGKPYLVLPYCQRGNINKLRGTFDEHQAWMLLRDAAGGLAYLHAMKPPLIHQDIKPANILVADNGDFMLTDFGVSTYAKAYIGSNKEDNMLLSAGTVAYMAPEKFRSNSTPIMLNDIWSLGATVYEMLSGLPPFSNDGGMIQSSSTPIPELPINFSPQLNNLVTSCLSYDSWRRPSAKDICETATDALKCIERGIPLPTLPSEEEKKDEQQSNKEEKHQPSDTVKPIEPRSPFPLEPEPPQPDDEEVHPHPPSILLVVVAVIGIILGIVLAFIF